METRIRTNGRTFTAAAMPADCWGRWIAVVGWGQEPERWSRVGERFASAQAALDAAVIGIARLVVVEPSEELELAA